MRDVGKRVGGGGGRGGGGRGGGRGGGGGGGSWCESEGEREEGGVVGKVGWTGVGWGLLIPGKAHVQKAAFPGCFKITPHQKSR